MKFIRDIISEKRALKQAVPVVHAPAPVQVSAPVEDRAAEPALRGQFVDGLDPAPLSASGFETGLPRNLFVSEAVEETMPEVAAHEAPKAAAEPDWTSARIAETLAAAGADWDDAPQPEEMAAGAEAADDSWPEDVADTPLRAAAAEPLAPLYLDHAPQDPSRVPSPFERVTQAEAGRDQPAIRRPAEIFQRAPQTAPREEPIRLAAQDEKPVHGDLGDMPFVNVRQSAPQEEVISDAGIQMPPPAAGRGSNRSGRVKTRLLGFNPDAMGLSNPFEKPESRTTEAFPVGWLVVVAGPGRGTSFPLHDGVSRIGRGEDQTVCLNFGDNAISRENHVSVAYDSEQNAFYIGQSGRSNIVRLNNKPLLSTEQIRGGDQIRVGETTLRLVALCDEGFSWGLRA